MEKLITTLTESVNLKLQEVQELTKMINLTVTQDIKAMRKFIHDHDTFERESFYSYLHHYDKEFFAKVYPHAHEDRQIGMYVLGVITYQFEEDKMQESKPPNGGCLIAILIGIISWIIIISIWKSL